MSELIYLASPIDLLAAEHDDVRAIRAQIRELAPKTWTLFRPDRAWLAGRKIDCRVQAINEAAVQHADAVLAVWPSSVPTRGVLLELGMARARGIPVGIIDPAPISGHQTSWALATYPVYTDPGEAVDAVMAGIIANRQKPPCDRPVAKFVGPAAPSRAYSDDAGYDLTYWEGPSVSIAPGAAHTFDLGVRVQLPPGQWYLLTGRSSMWKRNLMVHGPSIIDHGWRGPLFATVRNLNREPVQINPGERLAQLIPMAPTPDYEWVQVDELDPHERGEQGFGSSGR